MPFTAQVAVANATYQFDKLYTYNVPVHLQSTVHVGSMVLVPFGRGNAKARMGVVLSVDDHGDITAKNIKSLYDVAPQTATLSAELLRLVYYLKEHTFCTYYDAVRAIIPYGAQYKCDLSSTVPSLKKQITRHTQNYYKRAQEPDKFTQKQRQAWDIIGDEILPQSVLLENGITKNVIDRMCEGGILERQVSDKDNTTYTSYVKTAEEIELSSLQKNAYEELLSQMEQQKPIVSLLHGVTSSGKTLVFLKLVQQCLKSGKQALILVPEISLTPQMIYKLKSYFGEKVAVQHSALNNTERLLQWQQIQNKQADVVVGTRSAIFAPLKNIGIIIIDEEQEHTYHSESSPRYSAHDVAMCRIKEHNAMLLLASATPSVTSYQAAKQGRYKLISMAKRYNNMPLPSVHFADMRDEIAAGNIGAISSVLRTEMDKTLVAGGQVILLLNRRGYKTVGMCTSCAKTIKCEFCSVPMVYHKADNKLLCHYCANSINPVPENCPDCNERIKYTGFGTQRLEEELSEKFPKARVLRMDADSTSKKNAHEKMLKQFASGQYDILLGTQMVAKGLDFEKVSLVGVLGIDQLLFAQGYKAFENVFSLVTQVVGRSGRANTPGHAIIQTVDPAHPILSMAATQDYTSFFEQEIQFRKLNLYPPYCTLCLFGFTGEKEENVFKSAVKFAELLRDETSKRKNIPIRVLGPAPMNIVMLNNKFRYKLTVKCRNDAEFRKMLTECFSRYASLEIPGKAAVFADFHSDADI